MLMGFAAFSVDVGAAMSERRQDQSGSDMAAMVAVQFARGSADPNVAANNGANQAIAVANANLDTPPVATEWDNCEDDTRPGEYTRVSGVSECVSFTDNLQKARVLIPTIEVATTFGRVLGRESIATSAFAEAQGDLGQAGRVLPFGLPAGSAGDTEVCLRDSNNVPPPCDGPDSGNFGTLDFAIYGNETVGTVEYCNNPNQNSLATNMVAGIDHPIVTVDGEVREDEKYCPIFNARPNHAEGRTGIGSALLPGIVSGTSNHLTSFRPGRLARGSNRIPVDANSPNLDDTPLWTYIAPSGSKPPSCGSVSDTAGMATCIADWRSGGYTDPLFTLGISDAVRFGAVPQLTAPEWLNGKKLYGIDDVVPVYLQATFWKCSGAGTCEIVHYPGDPGASTGVGDALNGANRLDGLTAFVLELDMLPEPLRSNFPSTAEQVDYALVR